MLALTNTAHDWGGGGGRRPSEASQGSVADWPEDVTPAEARRLMEQVIMKRSSISYIGIVYNSPTAPCHNVFARISSAEQKRSAALAGGRV